MSLTHSGHLSSHFVQFGLTVPLFAGVSNWGGYAIACALYVLRCCDIHDRYLRRAVGFPRAPSRGLWLPALPSVTKVIPVPQRVGLGHHRRWKWPPAAESWSGSIPHQGLWALLRVPWEGAAALSFDCFLQRIKDRLQIKILQHECIHVL